MLFDALVGRRHKLRCHGVFHEAADHAVLRGEESCPIGHRLEPPEVHHIAVEPGGVVAPYLGDASARLVRQEGRGIGGEVPTLGMAAHAQPTRYFLRHTTQIHEGIALGGNHLVAQHEVLAPTGKRVVGTAIGHVGGAVRELERERRELFMPLWGHDLYECAEMGVGEPFAACHRLQDEGGERRAHACKAVDALLAA